MRNKRIHDFKSFINETNGYGKESFFFAKEGDNSNYLFKIEDGDEHRGFVLTIGKFSKFTQTGESKNGYGVLSVVELSEADLDQAVTDKGQFESNEKIINFTDDVARKFFKIVADCVADYLQNNPKVARFYDELQSSIQMEAYAEHIKDCVMDWPGGADTWHFQEVEADKLNIISK